LADVRYHFDEHMSGAVARELRRFGIDVETTAEAGLMRAPDEVHLAHAHRRGRVVVTEDEDFARLHATGQAHSGIVYFPGGRRSVGEEVEMLRLIHAVYTAEEMVGRLEYL
jgi:predicted nuclease of predicted toxin-antitoxin system